MKQKTLFLLIALFLYSLKVQAQSSPPNPLDMAFLNLIEGTWTGQSDMMGTKMNEELVCRMDLNKQFLIINLNAVSDDKVHSYNGMGVFGSDAEGNVKSWWFDEWGVAGISTGTGKIDGMKMTIDAKSVTSTTNRTMELRSGNLIMKWTGTWKDNDGNEQTMTGETTYTKKN